MAIITPRSESWISDTHVSGAKKSKGKSQEQSLLKKPVLRLRDGSAPPSAQDGGNLQSAALNKKSPSRRDEIILTAAITGGTNPEGMARPHIPCHPSRGSESSITAIYNHCIPSGLKEYEHDSRQPTKVGFANVGATSSRLPFPLQIIAIPSLILHQPPLLDHQ